MLFMNYKLSYRPPLTLFLVFFQITIAVAQNQSIADSLVSVYEQMEKGDTAALHILVWICDNQTDPQKKLEYSGILMKAARDAEDLRYLHHAYLNEGQAYRLMGDYDVAVYSLFKALDYAEKANYQKGVAGTQAALGDTYSILGKHDNSVMYYQKALDELGNQDILLRATILLNLGDEYYMSAEYDEALKCFQESRTIYERKGHDPSGLAYNLGNIGLVEAKKGDLDNAVKHVSDAIVQLEGLGDHYGSAIFLSYLSEIYQQKGALSEAELYADSSMDISKQFGLKAEIRDNSLRLADIHALNNNYEQAYKYHQRYVELKDSISNDEIYARIENLEGAFELANKQAEVNLLQERQKNHQLVLIAAGFTVVILLVLAMVIFRYYKAKSKINKVLEEQKRSLEALNETKDKFFSIISHDLRGPISSFHGVSNMIKYMVRSNQLEQLLEVADDIDDSVDNLCGLLDGLLNWATQQQGHFPNIPEKLDLQELVSDLVDTMHNLAVSKGIGMTVEMSDAVSLWADKNATMTILRNLVHNALKFTNRGGMVTISAHAEGDMAVIRIADSGVGMSAEKQRKLFKLQHTKSTFGTAGEKGLGLGLQLVLEFVEMNGGSVNVQSKEGAGTIFIVSLPLFESNHLVVNPSV